MSAGKYITREKVVEVKEFFKECLNARTAWVAEKCGIGVSTVNAIRNGKYDSLQRESTPETDEEYRAQALSLLREINANINLLLSREGQLSIGFEEA